MGRWRRLLTQFLGGQASLQAVNLLTALALLRWLSKENYAQFSVAFAFQSTLNALVDLGFSGSVIALVGERKGSREVIGHYIRAARTLRTRLSVAGILVSCVVFPILTLRQGWSASTVALLLGAIIAAVLFQSRMVYAAPLLMHGQLKPYYGSQMIAAMARLAACALLRPLGLLGAGTAACVAALATGINGWFYRRSAAAWVSEPANHSRQHHREMVRYLAPLMPGVVFTALQGQITIVLTTWFGKTANIAEVAALGRLAQVFLLLGAFNAVVIEPYMAALALEKLRQRYLQILVAVVGIAAALCVIGFTFPAPFVWLLGARYSGLEREIGWSITSAAISYVAGVIWTMNSARKWLYLWYTGAYIFAICVVQIICIFILDLSQTIGVLYFSTACSAANFLVHLVCGLYFVFNKRPENGAHPEV